MTDVFAPFTLPLRREGDAAIVDAHGKTVLVIDPDRDLEDHQATAIADHVFARTAATAAIAVGAMLRHHDGRTGTFVCIEVDGRYRVRSLKGKGFWVFHPDDCERLPSGAAPADTQAAGAVEIAQIITGYRNMGDEGDRDHAIAHLCDLLERQLLRAPSREPEGVAVDAMRRDMAAIGHAIRMLTDEIGRIPEKGRDPVTINNLEYYASQVAEWSGRYSALATSEEAPAEAGA